MTFPEAPFVVTGLILEGLTILAGRPKIGKSWLALAVCLAVAQGRRVLGNLATTQGDVLYAALEDNPRRLQKRIDKLLSPFSAEWPERLTLATSWRRLDEGGVNDIAEWAASVSNPWLVVLDTLAGVRPPKQNGEALYDADYRALVELHRLAVEKGFAVLVLHHTRKAEADDPLDTSPEHWDLLGALTLPLCSPARREGPRSMCAAETSKSARMPSCSTGSGAVGLSKARPPKFGQSDTRKAIFAVLAKSPEPLSPKDIADDTGLNDDNVRQTLRRMTSDGEISPVTRQIQSSATPCHDGHAVTTSRKLSNVRCVMK